MATVDRGEIIQVDGSPFYLKQPTEEMQRIATENIKLLKESFGDDIAGVYPVGSGAIPGMPGGGGIDLVLCCKNFPPTEEQEKKLEEIKFKRIGNAPHTYDDIFFVKSGLKIPESSKLIMDVGSVFLHFLHVTNIWLPQALAFVGYLTKNEHAFNRYKDVKIQGAKMQENKYTEDNKAFLEYKMFKTNVAIELLKEANEWAKDDSNFKYPKEIEKFLQTV